MKYILTGGPCAGKTTTLERIAEKGFQVLEESARKLITAEQIKKEKHPCYKGVFPWSNFELFEKSLLDLQLKQEKEAIGEKVFLDRSIVDIGAYAEQGGLNLWDKIKELLKDAKYEKVFFLDQLPFYKQDEQRKEDNKKATEFHNKLYESYERLGFEIIKVPAVDVEKRVEFILNQLKGSNREIESKFQVDNLAEIINKLKNYEVRKVADYENELNKGIMLAGRMIRFRENGSYKLEFKGKDSGKNVKNKLEIGLELPELIYRIGERIMPSNFSYSKNREVYSPLGNNSCKICLDEVKDLGNFVEIEAGSEIEVLKWKEKLKLENEVKESYAELSKSK